MKNLTLIVHIDTQQLIADTLRALPNIKEFSFAHVEGHGTYDVDDPSRSARDLVVGYTPHVRVDILLNDGEVDAVLAALRESSDGNLAGRGIYWVTEAERQGRL